MRKIAADRNYIRLKQAGILGDTLEAGKELWNDPKGYLSDKAKENISAWIKENAEEIAAEATKDLPMGGWIGSVSGKMIEGRADEISGCIVDIILGD